MRGVVPGKEVIESRFNFLFSLGELLVNELIVRLMLLGNCLLEGFATNATRSKNKQKPNCTLSREN